MPTYIYYKYTNIFIGSSTESMWVRRLFCLIHFAFFLRVAKVIGMEKQLLSLRLTGEVGMNVTTQYNTAFTLTGKIPKNWE